MAPKMKTFSEMKIIAFSGLRLLILQNGLFLVFIFLDFG
jgi:hypothetical protein